MSERDEKETADEVEAVAAEPTAARAADATPESAPAPETEERAVDVEGDAVAYPDGKRLDGKLGCLVTLVVGIACVAGAWVIMRVRSATQLDAAGQFASVIQQAENADGADALRDAGCDQAAVLPLEALRGIAQYLEDDRAAKEKREPKQIEVGAERMAVVCESSVLGCAKAGEVFATSIKNVALPFVVVVEWKGKPTCTESYAGDPNATTPREALAIPPIFSAPE